MTDFCGAGPGDQVSLADFAGIRVGDDEARFPRFDRFPGPFAVLGGQDFVPAPLEGLGDQCPFFGAAFQDEDFHGHSCPPNYTPC
jgi:hypothetical protein